MNPRVLVTMDTNEKLHVIDVRSEEELEVIFYLNKLKNVFAKCNLLILPHYFFIKLLSLITKMLSKDDLSYILIFSSFFLNRLFSIKNLDNFFSVGVTKNI